MEQTNLPPELCEPQKVKDPQTGLEKLVYLCYQPIGKRINFYKKNTIHFWTDLTLIVTVVVLLAGIISLVGYNFFFKSNLVNIALQYDETQIINGNEVLFNVNFENKSGSKEIKDAKLTIKLPDGLHEVTNDFNGYENSGSDVLIGTLKPKQKGEVKISGLLLTDMGSEEKFLFVLTYLDNYGQQVQEFTTKTFTVNQSALEFDSYVHNWLYSGSPFHTNNRITNLSKRSWDAKFHYEVSNAEYSQTPISDDAFKDIKPGESKEAEAFLTVSRSSATQVGITPVVTVNYAGKDYKIYQFTTNTGLANPKISVQINTEKKYAAPGEDIDLAIKIKNDENFTLNSDQLKIGAVGEYINAEKNTGDYLNTWSFDALLPGEEKTFQTKVATLGSIVVDEKRYNAVNLTITPALTFWMEGFPQSVTVASAPLTLPMSSALSLRSAGLFYTKAGDQIGVGSVPPRPDEYTAYWAILELGNQSNTVRNVRVTGTIPAGVEYDEVFNITLGTPVRRSGNQIEWYIPEVAPYAGISTSTPAARIQLAVVPSASDINKILPLLTNITVTGIDGQTGAELSAVGKDITTAIFADQSLNKVAQ